VLDRALETGAPPLWCEYVYGGGGASYQVDHRRTLETPATACR
jgi:hypothetical protein